MSAGGPGTTPDLEGAGAEMYRWIGDLYPICRSITGDGVRETLRLIGRHVPLEVREVPTGTPVFDWTVPREWNIRDAFVKKVSGERVVDFGESNLHVLIYSAPVRRRMPLSELKKHLFSAPEHPGWIPYRTSYYEENWGFCLSHDALLDLEDGEYEVCIDSSLEDGHLTYGECHLPGESSEEVLVSCHVCHPSLANDNLSGIAVATYLARHLAGRRRRYSYRFVFAPGTIGAITWLCVNESRLDRIRHGLVLACLGDGGPSTYKRSRRGDTEIDRAVEHVLKRSGADYSVVDFSPDGYDERQFCSPGFDLPVGCLTRTPHGRFPEYHTSADNLEFMQPGALADSLSKCLAVVDVLEKNRTYVNLNPRGEPQLGKRGLYRALGGQAEGMDEAAMLWVLNFSDGRHSLLDIAERSGVRFDAIARVAALLDRHGLLAERHGGGAPVEATQEGASTEAPAGPRPGRGSIGGGPR